MYLNSDDIVKQIEDLQSQKAETEKTIDIIEKHFDADIEPFEKDLKKINNKIIVLKRKLLLQNDLYENAKNAREMLGYILCSCFLNQGTTKSLQNLISNLDKSISYFEREIK